jgi:hypothetical protein
MAIFTSAGSGFFHQPDDFTGLRVPTQRLLGKDAIAVHLDLERAAGGFDELDLRVRKRAADFGRQTGGPGFVVSDDAVLDRDAHAGNDSGA